MAKKNKVLRMFVDTQGNSWAVKVKLAGSSNAMIVFQQIGAPNARNDRYGWYNADTPEARSVTSHLDSAAILQALTEQQLALLFRRSMRISAASDPLGVPVTSPAA